MKTFGKSLALAGLLVTGGLGVGTKPAEAQVAVGIATPGFSLGIGPQVGYGYYGGFVPAPVILPRPVVVAPPIYAPRAYYGGFRGGYPGYPGGYYGRPGYAHYRR